MLTGVAPAESTNLKDRISKEVKIGLNSGVEALNNLSQTHGDEASRLKDQAMRLVMEIADPKPPTPGQAVALRQQALSLQNSLAAQFDLQSDHRLQALHLALGRVAANMAPAAPNNLKDRISKEVQVGLNTGVDALSQTPGDDASRLKDQTERLVMELADPQPLTRSKAVALRQQALGLQDTLAAKFNYQSDHRLHALHLALGRVAGTMDGIIMFEAQQKALLAIDAQMKQQGAHQGSSSVMIN